MIKPKEEKKGLVKLEFLKNNRGCTISIALMSLILAVDVPLYYLTNLDNHYNSTPRAQSIPPINEPPNPNTPQLIDLGLPSGTLWADRNLGATAPEESGMYFAWAETEEKDEYSRDTYFNTIVDSGLRSPIIVMGDISGTKYDAATVILGPNYRMPTKKDMIELIKSCNWEEYKSLNGEYGLKATGPSGKYIFLPFCGLKMSTQKYNDMDGSYWTSTAHNPNEADSGVYIVKIAFDDKPYHVVGLSHSFLGLQIRPVSK